MLQWVKNQARPSALGRRDRDKSHEVKEARENVLLVNGKT